MVHSRVSITTKVGYVKPKTINLTNYAMGDDLPVDFTLEDWPVGQLLTKAYLTIKKKKKDPDAVALLQKSITATQTADGQITANGSSGTATGTFVIAKTDYGPFKSGLAYHFDVQVINDADKLSTPIDGTITFKEDITDATS
jgi:hypothetical protein